MSFLFQSDVTIQGNGRARYIDAYLMLFKHRHYLEDHWLVCEECLGMSKKLTLQLCDIIRKYYSKLAIVFSGCQGFHVHVLDFDYHDWVSYREDDPIWCHHAARFKFTKLLQKQTHVFDKRHFTVSVDPMRVVTVPNTVNGKTGLICRFIGSPKNLEALSARAKKNNWTWLLRSSLQTRTMLLLRNKTNLS